MRMTGRVVNVLLLVHYRPILSVLSVCPEPGTMWPVARKQGGTINHFIRQGMARRGQCTPGCVSPGEAFLSPGTVGSLIAMVTVGRLVQH